MGSRAGLVLGKKDDCTVVFPNVGVHIQFYCQYSPRRHLEGFIVCFYPLFVEVTTTGSFRFPVKKLCKDEKSFKDMCLCVAVGRGRDRPKTHAMDIDALQ